MKDHTSKNLIDHTKAINKSKRSLNDPIPLTRAIFLSLILKSPRITGYELMQLVPKLINSRIIFKSGTIYSELRRLEKFGFVSSFQSTTGRKQRRYNITNSGKHELKLLSNQIKDRIHFVLKPLLSLIEENS